MNSRPPDAPSTPTASRLEQTPRERSREDTIAHSDVWKPRATLLRDLVRFRRGQNTDGIARDLLALERTNLAMFRTSASAVALGVVVAKLIKLPLARVTGTMLVALGQVALFIGLWRYHWQAAALERRLFAPDTVFPWFVAVFLGAAVILSLVLTYV